MTARFNGGPTLFYRSQNGSSLEAELQNRIIANERLQVVVVEAKEVDDEWHAVELQDHHERVERRLILGAEQRPCVLKRVSHFGASSKGAVWGMICKRT